MHMIPRTLIPAAAALAVGLAASGAAHASDIGQVYSTPGRYIFTVPAGVTSLHVRVAGAGGGQDAFGNRCDTGSGAVLSGEIPVLAGETLDVGVGVGGGDATGSTGGVGGAPGGGHGGSAGPGGYGGGGGGGSSHLQFKDVALVAAGGGGCGGAATTGRRAGGATSARTDSRQAEAHPRRPRPAARARPRRCPRGRPATVRAPGRGPTGRTWAEAEEAAASWAAEEEGDPISTTGSRAAAPAARISSPSPHRRTDCLRWRRTRARSRATASAR
jgi:hypothetical protein